MSVKLCPICEAGYLHSEIEKIDVEYMGVAAARDSHYSVCDACGSEQATAEDARFNKRDMIAFKKSVHGLLTGAEVKILRKKWRLNQEQAAKVFGGGPVAFSKYEADDVMQSESMDKLLRLAASMPGVLDRLKADAGLNVVSVPLEQWQTVPRTMAKMNQPTYHLRKVSEKKFDAEALYA